MGWGDGRSGSVAKWQRGKVAAWGSWAGAAAVSLRWGTHEAAGSAGESRIPAHRTKVAHKTGRCPGRGAVGARRPDRRISTPARGTGVPPVSPRTPHDPDHP